jgi:Protein of unknown function (DUF732)
MRCRTIGVAVLTGAVIAFAPVAHADNDSDYISNLRSHGLSPVGVSEAQWETEVISNGHQICDMAAGGLSRGRHQGAFRGLVPRQEGDRGQYDRCGCGDVLPATLVKAVLVAR